MDVYCDTCTRVLNNALRDSEQPDLTVAVYHRDSRRFAMLFNADGTTELGEVHGPADRQGHVDVGDISLRPPAQPVPPMPDPFWLARLAGIKAAAS